MVKPSIFKIDGFTTKACDSFSSASMEKAPQNYLKNPVTPKHTHRKIELDGFTKSGPNSRPRLNFTEGQ